MHLFANEFHKILPGWWSFCSRKLQESIVGRFKWIWQGSLRRGQFPTFTRTWAPWEAERQERGSLGGGGAETEPSPNVAAPRSLSTCRSGHPRTQRHVSKCRSYHFLCVAGPTESLWYLTYTGANLGLIVYIANTVSHCVAWLPALAQCIHFSPYIAFFSIFYINPFSPWDPKYALPCPYLEDLWFSLSHSVAPCLLLHSKS